MQTTPYLARVNETLSSLLLDTMPRLLSQICRTAGLLSSADTTTSEAAGKCAAWGPNASSEVLRTKLKM
eukprot:8231613-Heterocapsa_arctica.AAC.1